MAPFNPPGMGKAWQTPGRTGPGPKDSSDGIPPHIGGGVPTGSAAKSYERNSSGPQRNHGGLTGGQSGMESVGGTPGTTYRTPHGEIFIPTRNESGHRTAKRLNWRPKRSRGVQDAPPPPPPPAPPAAADPMEGLLGAGPNEPHEWIPGEGHPTVGAGDPMAGWDPELGQHGDSPYHMTGGGNGKPSPAPGGGWSGPFSGPQWIPGGEPGPHQSPAPKPSTRPPHPYGSPSSGPNEAVGPIAPPKPHIRPVVTRKERLRKKGAVSQARGHLQGRAQARAMGWL